MSPPSAVWVYFTRHEKKATCNKCKKVFTYCGSTTSLGHHLKAVHRIDIPVQQPRSSSCTKTNSDNAVDEEEADDPDPKKQKTSESILIEASTSERPSIVNASNVTSSSFGYGPLQRVFGSQASFAPDGARYAQATQGLLYMIAKDKMPLSTPSRDGLRCFVKKLQPMYRMPCDETITKLMTEKYQALKNKVRSLFHEVNCLTITTDLWTETMTLRSFLGVTVHFLSGTEIKSFEIGAKQIDKRKTISNLREALNNICQDWGIEYDRIIGVVTDHGANIKGACREEFGVRKHVSCFAHSINLIAMNAIGFQLSPEDPLPEDEATSDDDPDDIAEDERSSTTPLKVLIVKVKKIVRFFKCSSVAATELKSLQLAEGKRECECLVLIQEVRTRWNSTYCMLERFLLLAPFVSQVLMKIALDKSSREKPPTFPVDEISALNEIKTLLRPLYQITTEMSSEKAVTISKCIPLVRNVKTTLENFIAITPAAVQLRNKLLEGFNNRFRVLEDVNIYAAATLLDPRFKKVSFQSIRAAANAMKFVGNLVDEKISTTRNQVQCRQETPPNASIADPDDIWFTHDQLVRSQSVNDDQDNAGGAPIELRQFLNRPVSPRKSNPFREWEALKTLYPHVYQVAMDYLPVLATSVPSERLFSHAGLIVNKQRTRLSGDHIDQLLFLSSVDEATWFA